MHTSTWAPGRDWIPLTGAGGPSTGGVWRVLRRGHSPQVVKRLIAPQSSTEPEQNPHHFRWWRREADVGRTGIVVTTCGLAAPAISVEEDALGITLWMPAIAPTAIPDTTVAAALGLFASHSPLDPGWFSEHKLRDRVKFADAEGGLRRLEDTAVPRAVELATEQVWERRYDILDQLDALPHVLSHGDALPRNLIRHDGDRVTAIDWSQLGYAPIGADLATFAMWVTSPPEVLLSSYQSELTTQERTSSAHTGFVLTTALIAVSRVIRSTSPGQDGSLDRLLRALPLMRSACTLASVAGSAPASPHA